MVFLDRENFTLLILVWGRVLLVGSGLDTGKIGNRWLGGVGSSTGLVSVFLLRKKKKNIKVAFFNKEPSPPIVFFC